MRTISGPESRTAQSTGARRRPDQGQARRTSAPGLRRLATAVITAVLALAAGLATITAGLAGSASPAAASQAAATCTPFSIQGQSPPANLNPYGIAVDASGDTYIASRSNSIRRVDSAGATSTFVQSADAVPTLSQVTGVAVDGAGNVYAIDSGRKVLFRFDSAGVQTLAIDIGTFIRPWGVAVDQAGSIYATDEGNGNYNGGVYRFDSTGVQTLAIAANAMTPQPGYPKGISVDSSGNIYLADDYFRNIYRFDSSGTQTLTIPSSSATPAFSLPEAVAATSSGEILVADRNSKTIYRFDDTGAQTQAIAASAATPALSGPRSIALGSSGTIHVGDPSTQKVYEFDVSGTQTRVFPGPPPVEYPGDVDAAADGSFSVLDPYNQRVHRYDAAATATSVFPVTGLNGSGNDSIAVDDSGNTYIGSTSDRSIRRYDASGAVTLTINQLAATPQFQDLSGIAVDTSGNIYVVDVGRDTVYRFNSSGTQTLAIPATAATPNLDYPNGVAADDTGNVYVSDGNQGRLYRFDATGSQTLVINQAQAGLSVADVAVSGDGSQILGATTYNGRVVLYDDQGATQERPGVNANVTGVTLAPGGFITADFNSYVLNKGCFDGEDPTVDLVTPGDGATVDLDSTVNAAFTCADNVAIQSCSGTRQNGQAIPTNTLGQKTFTVTATDTSQRQTVVTHTYTVVDKTKPTVQVNTPSQNATYALGQNVNASYSCSDGNNGSGIDTCVGDVANGSAIDTATLGAKTFTVTGTDNAGNTTEVVRNYTVTDQSQPSITITSPGNFEHFAQNEAVDADFECTDEANGSGLASCVGSFDDGTAIDTSQLGQKTFTVTATDTAGNQRTVNRTYYVDDVTDPVITLTTPVDNATYEQDEVVIADYSCEDEAGGSGLNYCFGTTNDGSAVDTSTLGTFQFLVQAYDNYGNYAQVVHTYTVIDVTAPEATILTPADGVRFDRDQVVVANYSCTDENRGSGVDTCVGTVADGDPVDTSTLGVHQFEVRAEDGAGNVTTSTHTYRVSDITKPTITITSPAANATFTQGQVVDADYTCTDENGGSGMDSCSGSVADGEPINTTQPGQQQFVVFGQDIAGNTAVAVRTYTVTPDGGGDNDVTKPTITITSPAANSTFTQGQVVNADYTCADENGGSGMDSCSGSVADGAPINTSQPGQHQFVVFGQDVAGNTAVAVRTYTVTADGGGSNDTTKPTVTITSPADSATFTQGQAVAAAYTCADENGGSGLESCLGSAPVGANIDTTTPGAHTFWVIGQDGAGNTRITSHAYTVTADAGGSNDTTKPTVTITSPADGATFALGQKVPAAYTCADENGGSGLVSCLGSAPVGADIDTATKGTRSFLVIGQDANGNTQVASHTYTVVAPPVVFTDVPNWLTDAVAWLTEPNNEPPYANGYSNGTFRPDQQISRGQMALWLYNVAGAPSVSARPDHGFGDVEPWIEDAVRWIMDEGIANGFGDNTFRGRADITRAQAALWFHRAVGSPTGSPATTLTDIPTWVAPSVNWLVDPARTPPYATGFNDGTYRPNDPITRGQAARMLYRIATNPV